MCAPARHRRRDGSRCQPSQGRARQVARGARKNGACELQPPWRLHHSGARFPPSLRTLVSPKHAVRLDQGGCGERWWRGWAAWALYGSPCRPPPALPRSRHPTHPGSWPGRRRQRWRRASWWRARFVVLVCPARRCGRPSAPWWPQRRRRGAGFPGAPPPCTRYSRLHQCSVARAQPRRGPAPHARAGAGPRRRLCFPLPLHIFTPRTPTPCSRPRSPPPAARPWRPWARWRARRRRRRRC